MSCQYTNTSAYCAACAYWSGNRRIIDNFGTRLEVDSPTDSGRCMNQNCGWKGQKKQANSGCSDFAKWNALR